MLANAFQETSQAFLANHPVGSTVTDADILAFAKNKKNGLANDLLHPDPRKQVMSVRRHVNLGGSSTALAEGERFAIVPGAGHGYWLVVSFADHALAKAGDTFNRSLNGALLPLKRSKDTLGALKLEELTGQQKKLAEDRLKEIERAGQAVAKVYSAEHIERWVDRFEGTGLTREQAITLLDSVPGMVRDHRQQRLLKSF
jgi:hypothetical protein